MIGQRRGCGRNRRSGQNRHFGIAERKEKPDSNWAPAFLHQFAFNVVDGCNMIGIDRMAQFETVGQ